MTSEPFEGPGEGVVPADRPPLATTSASGACMRAVDDFGCGHAAESHVYEHEDMVYSRIFECVECGFDAMDWYNGHLPCTTCNPPDREPIKPGPPFVYEHTPCWGVKIREAFAKHPFESTREVKVTFPPWPVPVDSEQTPDRPACCDECAKWSHYRRDDDLYGCVGCGRACEAFWAGPIVDSEPRRRSLIGMPLEPPAGEPRLDEQVRTARVRVEKAVVARGRAGEAGVPEEDA